MKQNSRKKKTLPPCEPWQAGEYSRKLEISILLPYQFLLLCKLWEVTPIDMITHFLDSLAHASWKREGRDAAKQKLVYYVLFLNYGKDNYSQQDISDQLK